MGNSGGKASPKSKKILIGIGIIVLVAIIVVVVLLCIPPNTYNAVQLLNKTKNNLFLSSVEEQENYNKANSTVAGSIFLKEDVKIYKTEFADYEKMYIALEKVYDFYDSHIIFASDSNNLSNQYKTIKENLTKVLEKRKDLTALLKNVAESESNTNAHIRNALIDLRTEYISYLGYNKNAIGALNKAFVGSMGNVLINNEGTKLVLNTIDDFISVIITKFKDVNAKDIKSSRYTTSYYNYTINCQIDLFSKFVNGQLSTEKTSGEMRYSKLTSYYFTSGEDFQTVIKDIKTYLTGEKQKNCQKIIQNVTLSGSTFNFSNATNNTVLQNFLKGEA